jgi:hypothetical protein
MRKYYNVEFNENYEIVKEYFQKDSRYFLNKIPARWTGDNKVSHPEHL